MTERCEEDRFFRVHHWHKNVDFTFRQWGVRAVEGAVLAEWGGRGESQTPTFDDKRPKTKYGGILTDFSELRVACTKNAGIKEAIG